MRAKLVGVSGNFSRPSKTRALVSLAVARAVGIHELDGHIVDLLDFGPSLGTAAKVSDLDAQGQAALRLVLDADALIFASPVYKGSYTGLFKHLIDLLDPASFFGKPILLAATGGGDRHALVVEHQLRPLFGFFEAHTLATGIYATERDFEDGQPRSHALIERLHRAIGQFSPHLPRHVEKIDVAQALPVDA